MSVFYPLPFLTVGNPMAEANTLPVKTLYSVSSLVRGLDERRNRRRSEDLETWTGVGSKLEGGPMGLSDEGKHRGVWKDTSPKCELTVRVIYPFKHLFRNHPTKF